MRLQAVLGLLKAIHGQSSSLDVGLCVGLRRGLSQSRGSDEVLCGLNSDLRQNGELEDRTGLLLLRLGLKGRWDLRVWWWEWLSLKSSL